MRHALNPDADGASGLLTAPVVLVPPRLTEGCPGMQAGFTGGFPRLEDDALLAAAWSRLGRARPVLMDQPHGAEILSLEALQAVPGAEPLVRGYDGLTDDARGGRTLLIKSADCVPVLALHPATGRYAALHAGWRGVAKGILPALLRRWREQGVALAGVHLALGPHIRPCCFAVREDCLAQFQPADLAGAVSGQAGAATLDLERVLRSQAAREGLAPHQVESLALCTSCHREDDQPHPFASYRRSLREGTVAGRNLSFIGPAAGAAPGTGPDARESPR